MANEQNLVPFTEMTEKQQREIASMGGKASQEARRKKKLIKDQMELLLSLPLKDKKAIKELEDLGVDTENIDNQMAMVISMWKTALRGGKAGVDAFNSIQASVGEKPVDKVEHSGSIPVVINDDITE